MRINEWDWIFRELEGKVIMRKDNHRTKMEWLTERINQINEWRNEAIKHAVTPEQKAEVEARVLAYREAVERNI